MKKLFLLVMGFTLLLARVAAQGNARYVYFAGQKGDKVEFSICYGNSSVTVDGYLHNNAHSLHHSATIRICE